MIGICTIFLFAGEWGEFLARQSIQKIRQHTRDEYRIYGYAPRASDRQIDFLSQLNIACLPTPAPKSDRPWSAMTEHSLLLDSLVSRAFADGCEFVATFDMDSWPIVNGWDSFYSQRLSDEVPVAAMVRTEFTDNFPFAAFTLLSRPFWREGYSSFASDSTCSLSRRPRETGSGILDQLARDEKMFLRLERTNEWNPHPIMAGLYDDAFFHVGAGSRTPVFISDDQQYGLNGSSTRRQYANSMNIAARQCIMAALRDNHDNFIRELAGGEFAVFEPILSEASSIPQALEHSARAMRKQLQASDIAVFPSA